MWHNNKKVLYTYAYYTSQWAWAYIQDLGWKRIKEGAADGCTNLFVMMNDAKASDRAVNVYIDADFITTAYVV